MKVKEGDLYKVTTREKSKEIEGKKYWYVRSHIGILVPAEGPNKSYIVEISRHLDGNTLTRVLKEITEEDHDMLVEEPIYRGVIRVKEREMELLTEGENTASSDTSSRSWEKIKETRNSTHKERKSEESYNPETASPDDPRNNKNNLLDGNL